MLEDVPCPHVHQWTLRVFLRAADGTLRIRKPKKEEITSLENAELLIERTESGHVDLIMHRERDAGRFEVGISMLDELERQRFKEFLPSVFNRNTEAEMPAEHDDYSEVDEKEKSIILRKVLSVPMSSLTSLEDYTIEDLLLIYDLMEEMPALARELAKTIANSLTVLGRLDANYSDLATSPKLQ